MKQVISFEQIAVALSTLGANIAPAEFHGTLCGILCTGSGQVDEWFMKSFPPADPSDAQAQEAAKQLVALYQETLRQLNDPEFDFRLLLPDDDVVLSERTESLGEWCQGFLMGLGHAGIREYDKLPGESAEICQDLVEIARATSYDLDDEEDDEIAYAELEEYVRVGILLINEELQPNKQTGASPAATVH